MPLDRREISSKRHNLRSIRLPSLAVTLVYNLIDTSGLYGCKIMPLQQKYDDLKSLIGDQHHDNTQMSHKPCCTSLRIRIGQVQKGDSS